MIHLTNFTNIFRLCRYTKMADRGKFPCVYLGPKMYNQIVTTLRKDCTFFRSFIDNGRIDPLVVKNKNSSKLEAGQRHADSNRTKKSKVCSNLCTSDIDLFLVD